MFGFSHPQPPHRKEVAMQIAQHAQKRFEKTLTVEEIPGGAVGMPVAVQALRFDVVYTLTEYLSLFADHTGASLRRRHGARWWQRVAIPFWVLVFGTPLFLLNKRRMLSASFHIDAAGIERTSRTGTRAWAWPDVLAVRRYRRGYVLVFARGAMPIPLRCLDHGQQEAFQRLVRSRLSI